MEGLRVIDAAIMPSNTNAPTFVMGEDGKLDTGERGRFRRVAAQNLIETYLSSECRLGVDHRGTLLGPFLLGHRSAGWRQPRARPISTP
jgi:hypothetical protein